MSRFLCASHFRLALQMLALLCLSGAVVSNGQSAPTETKSGTTTMVQGVVRDSSGHPLASATVSLEGKDGAAVTIRTDSAGAYRFSDIHPAAYTLRAEMVGYLHSVVGPFTLAQKESTTVDLTLEPAKSERQNSSASSPQFFDEPHFEVAGVTDTTNLGGHGSDTVVRNREALAKATAALSEPPSATLPAVSVDHAGEQALRRAVERQPKNFDANYELGKLLVDEGKAASAIAYLQAASQSRPRDPDNHYELALARASTGDYEHAQMDLLAVLNTPNQSGQKQAESHHLLAEVDEKLKDPLQAVKEYQRAAELNPTESYLFDWGTELLLHHAAEPAVEVFAKGNRLFPQSGRMLAGLGAAWYALGSYDKAVQRLSEASDLNPNDPNPYLLMGQVQAVETTSSEAIQQMLERFARIHPENALANYYYAVSIWKSRKSPEDNQSFTEAKSLLEKAVQLDPALGLGYLQLGILYSECKDIPNAVADYERATATTPDLEEAHYRLAQVYRQTGRTAKAQAELQLYEKISKEKAAEIDRQRHEVQQFVYQLRDAKSPANSQ